MAIPDCVTLDSLFNMLSWDLKKLMHTPKCQAQDGLHEGCAIIGQREGLE